MVRHAQTCPKMLLGSNHVMFIYQGSIQLWLVANALVSHSSWSQKNNVQFPPFLTEREVLNIGSPQKIFERVAAVATSLCWLIIEKKTLYWNVKFLSNTPMMSLSLINQLYWIKFCTHMCWGSKCQNVISCWGFLFDMLW